MNRILYSTLLLVVLVWANPADLSAKVLIRYATLAPPGTTFVTIMKRIAREIKKATNGEVVIKIYPGGRQGDEKDVVRKIRAGQLQATSLTSIGLSEVEKSILVLQLPGLFMKYSELDYVRLKMRAYFDKKFAEKGFKLLGWGDIGFIYMFTKTRVSTLEGLKKLKVWAWIDDPISLTFNRLAGITPKMIGLPGVYPSLKAGMLDAVYASPLGLVGLQWYTELKYVINRPMAIGLGGTLISKKTWDSIKPEHKKVMAQIQKKWLTLLGTKVRRHNRRALKLLITKQGYQVVQVSDVEQKRWVKLAKQVRKKLTGTIYPAWLLAKVKKHLKEFRAGKK